MSVSEFDALCDGPLAAALAGLEAARKSAVQRFWMILGGAVALGVVLLVLLGLNEIGWVLLVFLAIGGWILGSMQLNKAARTLKDPCLSAIGQARGFSHEAERFTADGYEGLHPLFGRPSQRTFRDRFHGEDAGQAFAFYEANLVTGSGRTRHEVFNGVVYALRRRPVQGETVIVPDKGLFNFFKPGKGMESVKFDDDPEFEKRFEVYSTRPDEARALVNPVVRETLKTWRANHPKIFIRIAGDEVTAAFSGKGDRFEAGSMLKSLPGRERVRAIWDDVERALGHLRHVRQTLG